MRVPNRQTRRTGIRLLAVGAALALILAACGGDDDDDDAAASATTTTTAAPSEGTTSTSGAGSSDQAATVAVATTSLGDVLVNESGRTLYIFENDTAPNASTCNGQCASTWPPLTVTGDIVLGDGLTESMFTTFPRDDGAMQVSVNGHPLYTYGADTKPGDTNGQGVGDIWYVVGANGQKIEAGEAQGASTSSSGGSGY
jgi:predicted lipoprotein with Yx(FWY)xxD motif